MATVKQFFAGISNSGENITKKNKKIFLTILASVLLVSAIIGVVAGVKSRPKTNSGQAPLSPEIHEIVKSSCSNTLHPELCYSTVATAASGDSTTIISGQKDVIHISLNVTIAAVKKNSAGIKKLIAAVKKLSKREKQALKDCIITGAETLLELHAVVEDLRHYPTKKNLRRHADDLKTLISSAITNQETCLDGFSHAKADKIIRKALIIGQEYVRKLCSNALAMIKHMTDTDMANESKLSNNRKLEEVEEKEEEEEQDEGSTTNDDDGVGGEGVEWPEWLSAGDRRLLQSSNVKADVVVAADGSGNFRTVSQAVANAPSRSGKRYVIRIKAGVYRENVDVSSQKTNIMFVGDGRLNTIITGSRSVSGGSTTFNSATVAAVGDRFLARDITFQNTAGPSGEQAVALRVGSDFSAFYRCSMIAYQDTLYTHINRQFYVNCVIVGSVDFIFGNAAVVIQNSDIQPRRPGPRQKNMLTASGRSDPNQNTGIVIQKCRIAASNDLKPVQGQFPSYLGRPWKEYARTVVMQSSISNVIHPEGWYMWDGNFALNTLTYREYKNSGAGADTSRRVNWRGYKVITSSSEAQSYTAGQFINGGNWLSGTGFPFSLGL